MSVQAGQLLVVRKRLTLEPGLTVVDTGIRQANIGVQPDPPMGGTDPSEADQAGVASRIMVYPLSPIASWVDGSLIHGEPYLDTDTRTVKVEFQNSSEDDVEINVLFYDPSTMAGAVDADTYLDLSCAPPEATESQGGRIDSGGDNQVSVNFTGPAPDNMLVLAFVATTVTSGFSDPGSMPVPDDVGWTLAFSHEISQGGDAGVKGAIYWRLGAPGDPASFSFSIDPAAVGGLCLIVNGFIGNWDPDAPFIGALTTVEQTTNENPLSMEAPVVQVPADYLLPGALIVFPVSANQAQFWVGSPGEVNGGCLKADNPPSASFCWKQFELTEPGASPTPTVTQNANAVGFVWSLILPGSCVLAVNSETFG